MELKSIFQERADFFLENAGLLRAGYEMLTAIEGIHRSFEVLIKAEDLKVPYSLHVS